MKFIRDIASENDWHRAILIKAIAISYRLFSL